MPPPRRSADEDSEDPSAEDLERFGHETAYCPKCGEEVWENAQYCASCGEYFSIPTIHPPRTAAGRRFWRTAIVLLAAAGLVILTVCTRPW